VARLRRLAVNYDRVPPALAALAMAPYAPWSWDRSMIEPGRAGLTGPTPVHHSGMGRM
jgi:hypothetical protein